MSLLGTEYASSDEDAPSLNPAPPVLGAMPLQLVRAEPTSTALSHNVRYDELSRPAQGPSNPFKAVETNGLKRKNVLTGYAEEAAISDATFTSQHRTFQSQGYAREPNANGNYVGDIVKAHQLGGRDIIQLKATGLKRKRQERGDSSIVEGDGRYLGPWAKPVSEIQYEERDADSEENLASDEEYIEEAIVPANLAPMDKSATAYQDDSTNAETSEFHGISETDYKGDSYLMRPPNKAVEIDKSFHPKKLVHTWRHGTKPITAIRFFPKTAHLLLSASADSKIKIFDVFREQELLRSYSGHTKALTDAEFSPTGVRMLSSSLDRYMKLWDVETGQCQGRFKTGAIPHVVKFNPSAPHEFLAGMSDKKIVQFDTRVPAESDKSMVQEYDHHLGPINTITFVDEDRRFITTSDDKSLRAWDINIPVPIKFIAEPYMYALTRATLHPSGKHALFQSGDNQIVVYAAGDRFRQNRKKSFRGHNTSGYAVDVDVSPDGGLVASGDSGGYVCFWDWKSCKMFHKIKASAEGAVTCVRWNTQTTSRVATAGTEGTIKYWD